MKESVASNTFDLEKGKNAFVHSRFPPRYFELEKGQNGFSYKINRYFYLKSNKCFFFNDNT